MQPMFRSYRRIDVRDPDTSRRGGSAIGDVMNGGAGLSIMTGATDHVVIDAIGTSVSFCPTPDC